MKWIIRPFHLLNVIADKDSEAGYSNYAAAERMMMMAERSMELQDMLRLNWSDGQLQDIQVVRHPTCLGTYVLLLHHGFKKNAQIFNSIPVYEMQHTFSCCLQFEKTPTDLWWQCHPHTYRVILSFTYHHIWHLQPYLTNWRMKGSLGTGEWQDHHRWHQEVLPTQRLLLILKHTSRNQQLQALIS